MDAFGQAPAGVVYLTLGKTGLKVSGVGCGIGLIPDPAVLVRAADLGVNYFDTARMYEKGKAEEIAGAALKSRRKKIVLASKTDALTKADVIKDMDDSLKALQTDYLDIWHLHSRRTLRIRCTDEAVEASKY
jgi:aryl-alcohol dehydrogenase-like predicted oxidoreductase